MSTKTSDSYVDIMEAGKSTLVHTPAPKKKKLLWSAGPPDHVGEKLALIECASILLIGISSYTIAEAAAAGYYGGRYLENDNNNDDVNTEKTWREEKNWREQAKDQVFLFIASAFNATLLNYSLSVGAVALLTCLVIRAIEKWNPGILVAPRSFVGKAEYTVEKLLAGLMVAWWLAGAAVMTFKGPFVDASNGYFAAWLGLIGSLLWAAPLFPPHSVEKKGHEESDKDKTLAMIALSSVVLIFSIISIGDWGNLTTANVIYGLLAAALSLFFAVVLGFAKNLNVHWDLAISVVLALMWVFAAIFLAAVGPFKQAGNGMFSTWLGTLCSVKNLMRSIYKTSA